MTGAQTCLVMGSTPISLVTADLLAKDGWSVTTDSGPAPGARISASSVHAAVARAGTFDAAVLDLDARSEGAFLELSDDEWSSALEANFFSAFLYGSAIAQVFQRRGSGTLIVVGSDVDRCSHPGLAAYGAAKAAVALMAKGMALDLAPAVRVCCVAAPYAAPEQIVAGVAATIAFLVSDEASYVVGSTYYPAGAIEWHDPH